MANLENEVLYQVCTDLLDRAVDRRHLCCAAFVLQLRSSHDIMHVASIVQS